MKATRLLLLLLADGRYGPLVAAWVEIPPPPRQEILLEEIRDLLAKR